MMTEPWPTIQEMKECPGDWQVSGSWVKMQKPLYEDARRAIAQAEAGKALAEAARRIVAHWQIVSAPATARGISTMGSLTADMEMALAAWEAVNR